MKMMTFIKQCHDANTCFFFFYVYVFCPCCALCPHSFIHKMNTVEFKSATFPNAGSRHLLDDSVMESHSPTRGQAESSTLSSGISLGKTYTNILITMTHSLYHHMMCVCFCWWFVSIYREQRGLRAQRRGVLASVREVRFICLCLRCFSITSTWKIIKIPHARCDCVTFEALASRRNFVKWSAIKTHTHKMSCPVLLLAMQPRPVMPHPSAALRCFYFSCSLKCIKCITFKSPNQ